MTAFPDTIRRPALGEDVQLGMLYNARTSTLYGGISLWDSSVMKPPEPEVEDRKIQDARYTYSSSIDESRKNALLDVEGSLELDLKIVSVTGSAKYLNDSKSSTHEARLDASYTITRRTRRIPPNKLAAMKFEGKLNDERFTHYVGEVVEGASATISIVQVTSSEEESRNISGSLKAAIVNIPISGEVDLKHEDSRKENHENIKISYTGPLTDPCITLEDARQLAAKMPEKLKDKTNTLYYTLFSVSLVDSNVRRAIRSIDSALIDSTAAVIKDGTQVELRLNDLVGLSLYQSSFKSIKKQITNFRDAFLRGQTAFVSAARTLLPELRDGNTDINEKTGMLNAAVALHKRRIVVADEYVEMKEREVSRLRSIIAGFTGNGFHNLLEVDKTEDATNTVPAKVVLSLGGPAINSSNHPLEKRLANLESDADANGEHQDTDDEGDEDNENDENNEDDGDDEDFGGKEEWFDDDAVDQNIEVSSAALRSLRLRAPKDVVFGVASINKVRRSNAKKGKTTKAKAKTEYKATEVGDLLLTWQRKTYVINNLLPQAPAAPRLEVTNQTISVSWEVHRTPEEEQVIPTTRFIIAYRPVPNAEKDPILPRATLNEAFVEVTCMPSQRSHLIAETNPENPLFDDCDYEITLATDTIIGRSEWSTSTICRTPQLPSVASEMINFYTHNKASLNNPNNRVFRKWDLDEGNARPSLYLGLSTFMEQPCGDPDEEFANEISVRMVDVAPEFQMEELSPADIKDPKKTMVIIFTGASGSGKSTQINAFISYLFGAAPDDQARLMTIDDRGASQSESVTQRVTCYRIRPLSPLFRGKTLLVVDTPGYADTRGLKRDKFVTAAMKDLFSAVEYVNAIVMVCTGNLARTNLMGPVVAFILELFATNVQSCLRTVYTFCKPDQVAQAYGSLNEAGWPVSNGEFKVDNEAFAADISSMDVKRTRELWRNSAVGQCQLLDAVHKMTAVTTQESLEVTRQRIELEEKCRTAETNILDAADRGNKFIEELDKLAKAMKLPPTQTIRVDEEKAVRIPVPPGSFTTWCTICEFTCHGTCEYATAHKFLCGSMSDDKCIRCPQRCSWTKHENTSHRIVMEKVSKDVVPKDFIQRWSEGNHTTEGGILSALDQYATLQNEITTEMTNLAEFTEKLMSVALLHNPDALKNYINTLIAYARMRNRPYQQIAQLITAKNTLVLLEKAKVGDKAWTHDSQALLRVFEQIKTELRRKMELSDEDRAEEENKPSSLYNNLRAELPERIRNQAPQPLRKSATYPNNLTAVVLLIKLMLSEGAIVATMNGFKAE